MDRAGRLGAFLRARRERVTPDQVGLPDVQRRRVPGLRREELAELAGISPDYYVRLEQGRDHQPSEQVLDALARALRLDDAGIAHLYELGRPQPPLSRRRDDEVSPDLVTLLNVWPTTPALVQNRRMDVLAANPLARELSPCYQPGTNLIRSVFLDPEVRERHDGLEDVLADTVAYLRATTGGGLDDPALVDIIGELSLKSSEFRELWASHHVHVAMAGTKGYLHPVVGRIRLTYQAFHVAGSPAQTMLVLHAPPGSADARALAALAASISAR